MKTNATYGLLINRKEESSFNNEATLILTLNVIKIEPGDKIRNLSSSYNEEPLADLAVKAYVMQAYENVTPDVAFYETGKIEKRDAERMVKTLTKLDKGLAKLNEKFGYTADFGAQVGRIANVLGVETIIEYTSQNGSSYDDSRYRFHEIGQGVSCLNRLIAIWREAHPLPVKQSVA